MTVRVCAPCHTAKGADDNFFRDFLTADVAGQQHPFAGNQFAGEVSRSVKRNQSELARLMQKATLVELPFLTPAGLLVRNRYSAPLPEGRVSSILFRMMRGLYFKSRKVVFPPDAPYEILRRLPSDWDIIVREVFHGKPGLRLGDVFACTYTCATKDPFYTLWLMAFYERVVFTIGTPSRLEH